MAKRATCQVCWNVRVIYLEGVELETSNGKTWYRLRTCKPCAEILEVMVDDPMAAVRGIPAEQAKLFEPA